VNDDKKSKKQLISELEQLRMKIASMQHGQGNGHRQPHAAIMNPDHPHQDFRGRFFSFVSRAPHYVLITDAVNPENPKILEANESACRMHGYDRNELIESPLLSLYTDESREDIVSNIKEILQNRHLVFETECLHRNGSSFPVQLTAEIISDAGIPVIYIIERNLADQKKAEDSYRRSERQLCNLLNNIQGMAYRCRNDSCWTMDFVSSGCFDLTGYQQEELIDNAKISFADLIHPDDQKNIRTEVQAALREQRQFQIEYRLISADGSIKYVWERGIGVYDSTMILFIEGFITDISSLKKTEQALRTSEKKYRTYIEHAPESIFIIDKAGNYCESNNAALRLTGYSKKELQEMRFDKVAPPDDVALAEKLFARLATEGSVKEEIPLQQKDGSRIYVSMHAVRLTEDHFIAFCSDITDRILAVQALRESEEKYRFLFDNIFLGIGISSVDGKVLIMNSAMSRIIGYTEMEIRSINIGDFYADPEDSKRLNEIVRKHGTVHNFEVRLKRKSRQIFWACLNIKPIRYEGLDAFMITCLDITDRVIAEEQFRKLSVAVEQSPVTIVIADRRGRIEYVNPNFTKTTGYRIDEVIGRNTNILKSGEQQHAYYEKLWKTVSRGEIWYGEFHNRKKNGELFWEKATIGPITDGKGHITHFIALKEDISEKKAIEYALSESEEKYRGLVEASVHGVVIALDNPLRLVFASKPMEAITGYTPEELEQMTSRQINEMVHPDDREYFFSQFRKRLAGKGKKPHREYRLFCKNGTVRWVEVFSTRIDYRNNPATLTIFVDITEYRKVENEKDRLEKQLRTAQKMETIGTLAGGIAHDFNNIMTPILGYAEMARLRVHEPDPAAVYLDSIIKAANKAKTLVSQILTFNRQSEIRKLPVNPGVVVDEALRLLRPSVPDNVKVNQQFGDTIDAVYADPSQIYQVVVNLCNNALQAMHPAGGVLTVSLEQILIDKKTARSLPELREGKNYARLTITDSGTGMDESTLERIFEPFFTTKPVDKGTGLGLSVVHGIVRSHDGCISVKSKPGNGSSFHVFLPVMAAEPEIAPVLEHTQNSDSESILVVDNEETVTDMIKQMLQHLGYKVTTCKSGNNALDLVFHGQQNFDLIIANIGMDGMSGPELAEKISLLLPDQPLILLTGNPSDLDRVTTGSHGIKAVLVKPVAFHELAVIIRKAIYQ
jgi:PAS domain S-box-containing protein